MTALSAVIGTLEKLDLHYPKVDDAKIKAYYEANQAQFQTPERVKAEFRFEGYNIFNRPHFLNPGTDGAALGNLIHNPFFGVIQSTFTQPDGTTSSRQVQVALRLNF